MKSDYLAYIGLTITMIIWGITDPVGKWMVRQSIGPTIPPVVIGYIRYFFGTLGFLFILNYKENDLHFSFVIKHYKILCLMGFLSVAVYQITYFYGLDYTAASDASLIIAFAPVWVLLLTFLTFNESITYKKGLGVIISLLGVGLIIGFSPNVHEPNRLFGDFLIIVSMLSYAGYSVVLQYLLREYDQKNQEKPSALTIITWVSVFGFIITIPFLAILTPHYLIDYNLYLQIPERIWIGITFFVVFATILANLLFVQGLAIIKASRTAIFANLVPLVAIVTSALFLGEHFDIIIDSLSFIFIILGVYLVNRNDNLITGKITRLENESLIQL